MSEHVFKLPDLGEGTVEAEIVAWHVRPGDTVSEGQVVVDVMTDKANVEVPAPVSGRVLRTTGEPGDLVPVGAELLALETAAQRPAPSTGADAPGPERPKPTREARMPQAPSHTETTRAIELEPRRAPADAPDSPAARQRARVITSPAIRKQAKEAGVDLREVPASGPRGRILRRDLEAFLADGPRRSDAEPQLPGSADAPVETVKVAGVRRVIAERMSRSKREIPHFAYVEEVDVTELEALRQHLNATYERTLSLLPFIARALIRALRDHPQCNARFDAEAGVLERHRSVHLGVATHTPDGLKVPVVRRADELDLWQLAAAIGRAADAARGNRAKPAELSGSTITLTSLGRLGGIASAPVINFPEVAVVGVNRASERPAVVGGQITVRTLMNLSSSFDHRIVDGFEAASLIQSVRTALEHPARLFLEPPTSV